MRPDRRKPLTDATDSLGRLQARIANDGERLDQDTLTGLEGAGAAAYFRAYSRRSISTWDRGFESGFLQQRVQGTALLRYFEENAELGFLVIRFSMPRLWCLK
jgi:hypothetical protein